MRGCAKAARTSCRAVGPRSATRTAARLKSNACPANRARPKPTAARSMPPGKSISSAACVARSRRRRRKPAHARRCFAVCRRASLRRWPPPGSSCAASRANSQSSPTSAEASATAWAWSKRSWVPVLPASSTGSAPRRCCAMSRWPCLSWSAAARPLSMHWPSCWAKRRRRSGHPPSRRRLKRWPFERSPWATLPRCFHDAPTSQRPSETSPRRPPASGCKRRRSTPRSRCTARSALLRGASMR
ncbi:hypothetical protein D9M68_565580 [compost metagenome]